MNEQKGVVWDEAKKLGNAVATSLGFMVIAVAVVIALALIMKGIYHRPPESDHGESPNGAQSRRGIVVPLTTDPTYRWHPSNIYHRR